MVEWQGFLLCLVTRWPLGAVGRTNTMLESLVLTSLVLEKKL